MIIELAMYKADDEVEAERVSARNELELCAFALKNEALKYHLSTDEMRADIITTWMEDNWSAAASEYRLRQMELEEILANLLHRRDNDDEDAKDIAGRGDFESGSKMDRKHKIEEIQDAMSVIENMQRSCFVGIGEEVRRK